MTTILGSVAISQITDVSDTTKALAVNFAGAATGTVSTIALPNAGQTFTLPNASTTLVGDTTSQTLTNKTIDASLNSITNITNANIDPSAAIDGSKISGNISGNAANVTGVVAVANGGTGATTAANARIALSAAQSGANADITSLTQTTVVALKGGSNAVSLQADPATTVWTMQLPAGAGTNGQYLHTNGAGVLSWVPPFPAMGNVAVVDQVNGNNSTASVGGLPFLTITAALAAATSGQQVYVLPGTYNESITIPSGVGVRGMSVKTVIIQQVAVTSNTTLVTMGTNARLEDVTLILTSSTGGLTLKGVEYPSTTAANAKIRNSIINISNTSVGVGTIYGVHSSGIGVSPLDQDCIRSSTISISAAVTTKVVGIYSDTANTFRFRDLNIAVQRTSGAGPYYGIETNNASANIICRHSSIFATSSDVSQTLGTIQLAKTTLQTNSANSLGFTSLDSCKLMVFSSIGNTGTWTGANGRFLRFGSGAVSTTEIRYNIPTDCIIKSIQVRRNNNTGNLTFTVRINGVDTSLTQTITAGNTTNSLTNASVSVASGSLLSIGLGQTANNSGQDASITLELY